MVLSSTCLVELGIKGVQIEPEVYAVGGKSTHACIMVGSRVYVIDAYTIGPQVCHRGSVEHTLSHVGERVEGGKLVGDACSRCQRYTSIDGSEACL